MRLITHIYFHIYVIYFRSCPWIFAHNSHFFFFCKYTIFEKKILDEKKTYEYKLADSFSPFITAYKKKKGKNQLKSKSITFSFKLFVKLSKIHSPKSFINTPGWPFKRQCKITWMNEYKREKKKISKRNKTKTVIKL